MRGKNRSLLVLLSLTLFAVGPGFAQLGSGAPPFGGSPELEYQEPGEIELGEEEAELMAMVEQMRVSIDAMVEEGMRRPGAGGFNGWLNNIEASYLDEEMGRCFDQAERLRNDLEKAGLVMAAPPRIMVKYLDRWRFWARIEEVPLIPGVTPAGHYRLEVWHNTVAANQASPIRRLVLDPWRDEWFLEYHDGSTTQTRELEESTSRRVRTARSQQRSRRKALWAEEDRAFYAEHYAPE